MEFSTFRAKEERPPKQKGGRLRWVWIGALVCFALAGLTGVLFRFGVAYGATAGLRLENIRHAHSHLMYFGWVTPALMALIWVRHSAGASLHRGMRWLLGALFGAALLAYPLFLAFGYTPVALGTARMPLAVIAAGLNMLLWYGFAAYYARTAPAEPRWRAHVFWDMALVFLVLSTLGAWGLSLLKPLGLDSALWSTALTHFFLDLFSEGWLVLALLGVAYAELQPKAAPHHWSLWFLGAGIPVTFALGMPSGLVPPALKGLASVGGVLVGIGLLANAGILLRALPASGRWWWGVPLALLALKALAQLAASLSPDVLWTGDAGLRILYLHLMLLGFVSLGLVAAARSAWGTRAVAGAKGFYAAVTAVLLSLVPLSSLWPGGGWAHTAAAWIALLPVLAALYMLARGAFPRISEQPLLPSYDRSILRQKRTI